MLFKVCWWLSKILQRQDVFLSFGVKQKTFDEDTETITQTPSGEVDHTYYSYL